EFEKADIIFVSGGNVYYLLEKTIQSGFDKVVKQLINKGTIYVGSSAGSVLVCPTVEFVEDLDDRSLAKLDSYEGLGLVDFLLLPHYGEEKYLERFNRIINKWKNKGYKIVPITNEQMVVVNGEKYEIIEK
ncbi:MAG: peptidase E, partial [Candidatus Omnitrophica bacterium]|nr:peptidase E [Candidatus Omnitrophota bacterium]